MWFLCLVAFVIGWSGVSYAFVGSNHSSAYIAIDQPDQMDDCDDGFKQHAQHVAAKKLSPQAQINNQSDATDPLKINAVQQHMQHQAKTLSKTMHCQHDHAFAGASTFTHAAEQGSHQSHIPCHECAQLHCQSLSSSLDTAAIALFQPLLESNHHSHNSIYTAQHVSGYWQEILRPPKA